MNLQDKFTTTRRELASSLIEREDEIDLALTALIAHEHCLFVGVPGTAKSLLCDTIARWLGGTKAFYRQLTKFTTPEELFGPISVIGLKSDVYRRIPTGMLPEAVIAVLDEFWNASSAILNTLQRAMNEREWVNDGHIVKIPLRMAVAGSNRWPGDTEKELDAVFDRFLFRKQVKPIATARGLSSLLWTGDLTPHLSTSVTPEEIDKAHSEATALPWTDAAKEAFTAIIGDARREGIVAGDRRVRKSVAAAQSYAWLSGGYEVLTDHLEILSHTLWADPAEQPRKLAEIVGRIANPQGMRVTALLQEAEQIIAGADLKNLGQAAACTKKLSEIHKTLATVSHPRAIAAKEHIAAEVKRIKMASIEAL